VETFGLSEGADWRAVDVQVKDGGWSFRLLLRGKDLGEFALGLGGEHNLRNALAALAAANAVGVAPDAARAALAGFAGVKRRLEVRGRERGVVVYDDFAHHPTAVAETLAGLRAANRESRIWAVFEPRSASSCRRVFQDDFARAIAAADEVLLAPVFRSTLPEAERLSVPQLVRDINHGGGSARDADSIDDIINAIVEERRPGDLVVIMSNGGFGGIHQKLLRALDRRAVGPREA
jgi:UDP-N-acetylmuramate: L-alanyl-gamma-D-glutamyl-meso-diaminopimelate ligase